MNTPASGWLNGVPETAALAFSRGLHYGDGVFRTLLKFEGHIRDLEAQLDKLLDDAAALKLSRPDKAVLQREIEQAGAGNTDRVIKVVLIRAGVGRGYRARSDTVDRLILCYPLPAFEARCWRQGIAAFRSPVTMATQPLLAGIKHLNRLEQVLASRDWLDDIDEAILCSEAGAPICGTRSNLFWVARDVLHTANLDRCGVAGMMRAKVLACAADAGLKVQIESLPWSALIEADEAFVSSSLIGIWPLRRLDEREWSAPGTVTRNLMRLLDHPTLQAR